MFFSVYSGFLLYLSLVIQGIHKATMHQKFNLKRRKGSFNDQVWPHQHPPKGKWSLAEEPADEVLQPSVPEFLPPVDSLCAGMWKYCKQQCREGQKKCTPFGARTPEPRLEHSWLRTQKTYMERGKETHKRSLLAAV